PGRRRHYRAVGQPATPLQTLPDRGERCVPPSGLHLDATDLLGRVTGFPVRLLVEDGVDTHRGLAGLAVADDELALAAADRGLRVDGLDPRLQWFFHRLAVDDRRCLQLQHALLVGFNVAQPVERQT